MKYTKKAGEFFMGKHEGLGRSWFLVFYGIKCSVGAAPTGRSSFSLGQRPRKRIRQDQALKGRLNCEKVDPFPRSQVALGNALVGEAGLPPG